MLANKFEKQESPGNKEFVIPGFQKEQIPFENNTT